MQRRHFTTDTLRHRRAGSDSLRSTSQSPSVNRQPDRHHSLSIGGQADAAHEVSSSLSQQQGSKAVSWQTKVQSDAESSQTHDLRCVSSCMLPQDSQLSSQIDWSAVWRSPRMEHHAQRVYGHDAAAEAPLLGRLSAPGHIHTAPNADRSFSGHAQPRTTSAASSYQAFSAQQPHSMRYAMPPGAPSPGPRPPPPPPPPPLPAHPPPMHQPCRTADVPAHMLTSAGLSRARSPHVGPPSHAPPHHPPPPPPPPLPHPHAWSPDMFGRGRSTPHAPQAPWQRAPEDSVHRTASAGHRHVAPSQHVHLVRC